MPLRRRHIEELADFPDLDPLHLSFDSIDDEACALLGFQRTKQISNQSRADWETGETSTLFNEVRSRKPEIIRGAFLEVYKEYIPLRDALAGHNVQSVCDIGCGQALNDVFLHKAFTPSFTLVDIEETENQYHFWADSGSGYASLDTARELLIENGVPANHVTAVNPRKTDWIQTGHGFDLVTSLYSCGFHYPVDDYIDLFVDTVETGGAVCLDLRKQYLQDGGEGLSALLATCDPLDLYRDRRSVRMLFRQ